MKRLIEQFQSEYYRRQQPASSAAGTTPGRRSDHGAAVRGARGAKPLGVKTWRRRPFQNGESSPAKSRCASTHSCSRRCAPHCCVSCADGRTKPSTSRRMMQQFGRMRLDIENCVRELLAFGLAQRVAGRRLPALRVRPAREPRAARPARRVPRAARDRDARGPVAVRSAFPRDDRPRREDARRVRVDPDRREVRHLGADPRTDRLGQGSRRADDPRAQPPRDEQVPGGQHGRASRHAVRVGDLRLREGRVHRRVRPQAGPARDGQQRHALPRRDRRHVAHRAGKAAARSRGAPVRAARRQHADRRQFPSDLGH